MNIGKTLHNARLKFVDMIGYSPLKTDDIAHRVLQGESVAAMPGDFVLLVRGCTDEGSEFALAASSAVSAVPCFYYAENEQFIWGATVFDVVRKAGIRWEWNVRALNCVALMDHCLAKDSLHMRVKRMEPATLYFHCEGLLEVRHTAFPSCIFAEAPISMEEALDRYDEVFTQYCSSAEKVALSMSAGLDSRALLAGLLARGRQPVLGTMGKASTTDLKIARKIAGEFGLEHRWVELKEEDYLKWAFDIIKLTGGTKTLANWHTFIYAQKVDFADDHLHFAGANGELFRSYYFDKGILARIADRLPAAQAMKILMSYKYSARRRLSGNWVATFDSKDSGFKLSDVPAFCVNSVPLVNSSLLDRLDYFYMFERVRHFIGNGIALYNACVTTSSPFLDFRVAEAGVRLHRAAKQNDSFHRSLIRKNCPGLLDFPVDESGRTLADRGNLFYWLRHKPSTGYGIQDKLLLNSTLREIFIDSPYLNQFMERKLRKDALAKGAWQVFNFLVTMHFTCAEIESLGINEQSR